MKPNGSLFLTSSWCIGFGGFFWCSFTEIIRTSLCGCIFVFSLSIHSSIQPSVLPSVRLRSLSGVYLLSLALSGSYYTYRVPLDKGFAVILKQDSRSKVKVIAELSDNPCSDHMFFPLGPIWLVLHQRSVFEQRIRSDLEWTVNKGQGHKTMQKKFFRACFISP